VRQQISTSHTKVAVRSAQVTGCLILAASLCHSDSELLEVLNRMAMAVPLARTEGGITEAGTLKEALKGS